MGYALEKNVEDIVTEVSDQILDLLIGMMKYSAYKDYKARAGVIDELLFSVVKTISENKTFSMDRLSMLMWTEKVDRLAVYFIDADLKCPTAAVFTNDQVCKFLSTIYPKLVKQLLDGTFETVFTLLPNRCKVKSNGIYVIYKGPCCYFWISSDKSYKVNLGYGDQEEDVYNLMWDKMSIKPDKYCGGIVRMGDSPY